MHPGTETEPFRSVLHLEGTETLQITPEHRFGSNGGYWVRSCEKLHQKFGGRNCAFGFCFDFRAVGIRMVRNTPEHDLGPKRVDWKCP